MEQEWNRFASFNNFAKYPEYANKSRRQDTFNTWTISHSVPSKYLVGSGLFHTGVADCVRCFSCGGGMRNWEHGDDPWIEHARWFPHCQYVKRCKGQRFVDTCLMANGFQNFGRYETAANQRYIDQQTLIPETVSASTSSNVPRQSNDHNIRNEEVQKIEEATLQPTNHTDSYLARRDDEYLLAHQSSEATHDAELEDLSGISRRPEERRSNVISISNSSNFTDRETIGKNQNSNIADVEQSSNTTGREHDSNATGGEQSSNTTGREYDSNVTGVEHSVITTGREHDSNVTGGEQSSNTTGREYDSNVTGVEHSLITTGREHDSNVTGGEQSSNTTGREYDSNVTGVEHSLITTGREHDSNVTGGEQSSNTTGRNQNSNIADVEQSSNTTGREHDWNVTGGEQSSVTTGREHDSNVTGGEQRSNTTGREHFLYEKLKRAKTSNVTGGEERSNVTGGEQSSNTTGREQNSNTTSLEQNLKTTGSADINQIPGVASSTTFENGSAEENQRLSDENELLKQQITCKVCMDNEICMVFLPCGHMVCCFKCALQLRNCAVCRGVIKGTVRALML